MGAISNKETTHLSSLRFASYVAGGIGAPLQETPAWSVNAADEADEDEDPQHCPMRDLRVDSEDDHLCGLTPKCVLHKSPPHDL